VVSLKPLAAVAALLRWTARWSGRPAGWTLTEGQAPADGLPGTPSSPSAWEWRAGEPELHRLPWQPTPAAGRQAAPDGSQQGQ
jgi:hypothetical protein